MRENPVDPSVRPTEILTRVGSVLRQSAKEASPVLRASPPSPSPPCPPPPRCSPSLRDPTPRESSSSASSHPPTRSPLLRHRRTVVTPPALPPSSASSSCRYRYHYHGPRHYHRRDGVDDASSSTFSWPSPPAESTWWLPHHVGDPALLSTNDQRLSLLRGASRTHGGSRDLSPLRRALCPTCLSVGRSSSLPEGGRSRKKSLDFCISRSRQ